MLFQINVLKPDGGSWYERSVVSRLVLMGQSLNFPISTALRNSRIKVPVPRMYLLIINFDKFTIIDVKIRSKSIVNISNKLFIECQSQ